MDKESFLEKVKLQFTITDADTGNFPHTTVLEEGSKADETILSMPRDVYGDYVEAGDVISFNKPSKHRIEMVNLSCKYIRKAGFLRSYNSIFRQITSVEHPLNRVILNYDGENYLLKRKI